MEGKELYNNEDEDFDPKSKKEEEDADEFGLPEIEETKEEDPPEDLADPYPETWDDKPEEDNFSFDDTTDDYSSSTTDDYGSSDSDSSSDDFSYDTDDSGVSDDNDEYRSSYYEEEYGQKKFPVGWIIFAVFVLIAIIVGVFWWLNREPEPEQVAQPVIEQPVVQQPEPDPEPVIEEPEPEPEPEPVREAGVFEINEPTGRYHVIVASSVDKDLVHDYGMKLAKEGISCSILAPRGNRIFHRLSVADFASLNDAAIRSEQLKGTMGEDVWVIRY